MHYIPWGTSTNVYIPIERTSSQADYLNFFHSAGYSPYRKGTDLLLRAFDKVQGKAKLIIHTQVDLKLFMPRLLSSIQRMEINGKLEVIKGTYGAPGLYHLGDAYVYPSRLDGIGLTIFEALSCGLPVITTDAQPMNERINQDIGRLVYVENRISSSDGYY